MKFKLNLQDYTPSLAVIGLLILCVIGYWSVPDRSYAQEQKRQKFAEQESFVSWEILRPLPGERIVVGKTVYRTKVPSGWLVTNPRGDLVLVPDQDHTWKAQQKK